MTGNKTISYSLYTIAMIFIFAVGALAQPYLASFYIKYLKKSAQPSQDFYRAQIVKHFQMKEYEQSIEYAKKAMALSPNDPGSLLQLAEVLIESGHAQESIQYFSKIRDMHPAVPQTQYNLGYAYSHANKISEAIECFDKAIALNPHYQLAHSNKGECLLKMGDYEQGWKEFAWHWKEQWKPGAWNNIDLRDKTILCADITGLGDTLHFVRYLEYLKERGAKTILRLKYKPLAKFLSQCAYIDKIIFESDPIPVHDAFVPVIALPMILNVNKNTIAKHIPYLKADTQLHAYWNQKLSQETLPSSTIKPLLKVGICWHTDHKTEMTKPPLRRKSILLKELIPLLRHPNITFYSLQKYEGTEELAHLPSDITVHDLGFEIDKEHGPFMDTAAIIKNLDLVISTDTAIAHLTGALGKPVWLMLNFPGDWRWMINRNDCPLYPTMTIFRKSSPNDWSSVVDALSKALNQVLIKKT
jgi:tetratricopeptide (TPR) repeat protein